MDDKERFSTARLDALIASAQEKLSIAFVELDEANMAASFQFAKLGLTKDRKLHKAVMDFAKNLFQATEKVRDALNHLDTVRPEVNSSTS